MCILRSTFYLKVSPPPVFQCKKKTWLERYERLNSVRFAGVAQGEETHSHMPCAEIITDERMRRTAGRGGRGGEEKGERWAGTLFSRRKLTSRRGVAYVQPFCPTVFRLHDRLMPPRRVSMYPTPFPGGLRAVAKCDG